MQPQSGFNYAPSGQFFGSVLLPFYVPGTYTFTVPSDVTQIRAWVLGAGGSGAVGVGGSGSYGTGAGGGAFCLGIIPVQPGASMPLVVGAGGAAKAAATGNGNAGGFSRFGPLMAGGGGAGQSAASVTPGATGGVGVGGY